VMAYPDSDVIILCFSVVRPDSMENILSKWIIELNRYIPNVLIVLVGTQVDLRDQTMLNLDAEDNNYKQRHISTKEGEELRQRIKAFRYIECSALTQVNVKEVFDSCIDAHNSRIKKAPPSSCFQILLRSFANSLRRFRFHRRGSSGANSTSASANTGCCGASVNNKLKYSKNSSRKYLHES
jgi:GTPase SAR1 family protein